MTGGAFIWNLGFISPPFFLLPFISPPHGRIVVRLVSPPIHRHLERVFQKASEDALAGVAEGLVGRQIGPGGSALRGIEAVGFGFFEAIGGFFFDIDFELAKELVDAAEVLEEWITI